MDKKLIIIIVTTVCLMAAFLYGYDLDKKNQMKVVSLNKSTELYDEREDMKYSIDSIKFEKGIGEINGWAIVNGIDSIDVKPSVVLRNENDDMYKIKTRIQKRRDITKLITNENKKYDNSGITSEFYIKDLPKRHKYQIGIQIQIKEVKYFIWTNKDFSL
ncbi:hypothetical protein CPAST_c17000 [Clostridium pasteurianum DSM 525 = ATCC 6013]|uniref:Uncharacterized protein n=1 Tax=Clostridium pasteurianum DSM 525 = ATCC 6013 TaxID=1262449 RepID=A0A0H3J9H9_CLOPA|nr:hypothetical protein [Clostridium pasteurianum]AJA47770.1 hypothetical protein CPAST_c17000 [Clostridium pasteurianum DSM 525 = ATCC 6013]AJA51758.1 hypothetical protein CLPA_c17000 [Clostridium pasteurianum DSM 525 = ATCC 6013]AOZ75067.1 hypothetical protein AQ983_08225 [Clostridium pasteurianum DSM 525 = ATCC 6013]AOZ78862.1 hypothetical protein AQ984_08215 [Clostridium pasteurianum]ELP59671.1 hypothetical protein F502_07398 [Clostridium pasteurianum DSM 525 = ATCC 6013]